MSEIIAILALIILNGIFSMSEMALISSRKAKLKKEAQYGNKTANRLLALIDDPNRFLSTIQIGITTIGILTGIYSGDVLADDFSEILQTWGINASYSHIAAQSIIVIITTYLTLLLGELIPKRLGMAGAEQISLALYYPMQWLSIIATPFVWILSKSTELILSLTKFQNTKSKVTEEEIKMIIQEGKEDGEVKDVEQNIIERVFLIGDIHIASLQTHRNEITWLDINNNAKEIQTKIEKHIHNIYPVADKNLDNLIGVVSLKDIVTNINKPNFSLKNITRQANFIYENTNVYTVLEKMKANHLNNILVCDEFGSLQGIVSLHDIIDSLLGDILDNENDENIIKREDQNEWLVSGQCPFPEFLSYFDMEELYQQNNYNTISGLILDLTDHIPATGETIEWQNLIFEIADMDRARIDKILVKKKTNSETNSQN